MIFTYKVQRAIRFSIKTHEVYQKQKRKGKDIPYITHPLTVGLILARAQAREDVVVAGILHDTIEDSVPEKKVSREMLEERFGMDVADLVESVSENTKELSWEERKRNAREHIKTFSTDSLLLKTADIVANTTELIIDHITDGDDVFARFNAPKERTLAHYLEVIALITDRWPDIPLIDDLRDIEEKLRTIGNIV